MPRFGAGLSWLRPLWGPAGLGADCGVEIPSNLLISSGCLGLSGLNLTDCASVCGALRACGGSGGGALVGFGGMVHGAGEGGGSGP